MKLAHAERERLFADVLPWREILRGPAWLHGELVATPAARERIHRWLAAGGLDHDTPERCRELLDHVALLGDDTLIVEARVILARFPAVVLDHLVRHVVIAMVGRTCDGFFAPLPASPPDASESRTLLGVSCRPRAASRWRRFTRGPQDSLADFGRTLAHEIAHAFLEPAPSSAAVFAEAVSARHTLLRLATAWSMTERLIRPREAAERQAVALAACWGYPDSRARCARGARERFVREAVGAAE